ncbi:cob(I)yrinic acid a,c-diamide adenosyltransferase [Chamaesiphon sp.]
MTIDIDRREDVAALVTEMTIIKHPSREQGVKAQLGIEF